MFLAIVIPPAVFPGFLELLLAQLVNTRLGLDAPVILNDKLYVVDDRLDLLFKKFIACGSPFTILVRQLIVIVEIPEDHDPLGFQVGISFFLRVAVLIDRGMLLWRPESPLYG